MCRRNAVREMKIITKACALWNRLLTFIRKNPWSAVRRTLLVGFLLYTGIQLFTPIQYHGVIRAVMKQTIHRMGDEVQLDFSQTGIADNQRLQEQICESLTPLSIKKKMFGETYTYHLYLDGLRHIRLTIIFRHLGKYDVSADSNWIEDYPDGMRVSGGPFAAYGFTVYYNPFLLSWRAHEG